MSKTSNLLNDFTIGYKDGYLDIRTEPSGSPIKRIPCALTVVQFTLLSEALNDLLGLMRISGTSATTAELIAAVESLLRKLDPGC